MEIGIWKLVDGGIECNPENLPSRFIAEDVIWAKREFQNLTVWDNVCHMAERDWTTFTDCVDLLKIMSISRKLKGLGPTKEIEKIDGNTLKITRRICPE